MKTNDIYSSSIAFSALGEVKLSNSNFNYRTGSTIVIDNRELNKIKADAYDVAFTCVDNLSHLSDTIRHEIAISVITAYFSAQLDAVDARNKRDEEAAANIAKAYVEAAKGKDESVMAAAYQAILEAKNNGTLF